ncbi:hypothetical protein N8368_00530 [Bacteroidia bacterium]|nr:hypothetical protein [Bacteroidia bacterium]
MSNINDLLIKKKRLIYLCTDDNKEVQRMKQVFGKSICYFPVALQRNKPKAIQMALLDLLTLSRANVILGSYWSSFSEVASYYGGVELLKAGIQD